MSKVTSKLQISIPKRFADAFGIEPGDDLSWDASGGTLRLLVDEPPELSTAERLRMFDESEARRIAREEKSGRPATAEGRGWTRESLYDDRTD